MALMVSTALLDLPRKPHVLYRFFDRTDQLLYVGITVDFAKRIAQHKRDKVWWPLVENIKLEHFDNRRKALNAERKAIDEEKPLYNEQHNELVEAPPPGCEVDGRDIKLMLSDAHYAGQRDLAYDLLDGWDEEIVGHGWAIASRLPPDERSGGDPIIDVASAAIAEAQDRLGRLEDALCVLMEAFTDRDRWGDRQRAKADVVKHMGSDHTEFDILCWTAHVSARRIAAGRTQPEAAN